MVPVVRALLDCGYCYRDIVEMIEQAVVAASRAKVGGSDQDVAGCAGLSPSAVRRWRAGTGETIALPLSYAAGTRLISRWRRDPDYSDGHAPRLLPLKGRNSFATLAKTVDSDPQTALRELTRLRLVKTVGKQVRLIADAYVPGPGVIEKLDILGRDGAEFLGTMIHNVSAPPAGALLQRRASYDNIGRAALGKGLRARLRQQALEALAAANGELAGADRDRNPAAPGGGRMRVSFGIYVCEEPLSPTRSKRLGTRKRTRR